MMKRMHTPIKRRLFSFLFPWMMTVIALVMSQNAFAASAGEINRDANAAMQKLYAEAPVAKKLAGQATAILIFPKIVKAGLVLGAQSGEGVLRKGKKTLGYYRTTGLSYGLQAGAQTFGYVMFLMTEDALAHIKQTDGWEVGVGPSFVVVDEGKAKTLTTTTAKEDIYAFVFGQEGLMAGLGLQGSKITPFKPE